MVAFLRDDLSFKTVLSNLNCQPERSSTIQEFNSKISSLVTVKYDLAEYGNDQNISCQNGVLRIKTSENVSYV